MPEDHDRPAPASGLRGVDGLRWVKGHGTENDFLLVPDADGSLGPLDPALVVALCDRHAGLGADGVIRVVRADATDDAAAVAAREHPARPQWFMDYRNSDGSLSEMCGNGVRVLGRYLALREGVDPSRPLPVATRGGVKVLTFEGGTPRAPITVDMGTPAVRGSTWVEVGGRRHDAVHVDMGNPHAVAFVDDLGEAGPLLDPPGHDPDVYPGGVNVEFVVRRGPEHVALRVHERGSGETRSCGTGACAVLVAVARSDGFRPGAGRDATYAVDVPGGTLTIRWTDEDRVLMTGPAELVAEGYWFA